MPRAATTLLLLLVGAVPAAWAQVAPEPADDGGAALAIDAQPAAPADPDAPTVGASLDRTEAHVGDQLTLTVTAVAAGPVARSVTLGRPELGAFEVLDTSQTDQDLGDGRTRRRFVLQIAAYAIGEFEIPSVALDYQSPSGGARQLRTDPIPAAIRKVVDDPNADLQPLAHTREVLVEDRRPLQALVALGVTLALVTLGLVTRALVRRSRRREAQAPRELVTRPAHEIALERIGELRRRGQFAAGSYQPFHFALAEVVRGYLGARYHFDALELTTTELLEELGRARAAPAGGQGGGGAGGGGDGGVPGAPPIGEAELVRAGRFLEACDLVKFARAASTDQEALALLGEAEVLVRATQWLATVAPVATAGPAVKNAAKVAHG